MRNIQNILLTEKYRPQVLEDLITPQRVSDKLIICGEFLRESFGSVVCQKLYEEAINLIAAQELQFRIPLGPRSPASKQGPTSTATGSIHTTAPIAARRTNTVQQ